MIKIANNTNTLYVWIAFLCLVECLIVILASNNTLLDGISCQWRGFSITASIVSFIACFVCLKDKCLIFNQHFSITLIIFMCFALTRMCGTVMDYCNVILCCVLCANLPVLLAQVRKSVDSPPGMLTEDHHHTVHEERQVCYSSHLRPKSLHL